MEESSFVDRKVWGHKLFLMEEVLLKTVYLCNATVFDKEVYLLF